MAINGFIGNNMLSSFSSDLGNTKKNNSKLEPKNMSVKEGSAAEAAGQTKSKPRQSTKKEVILPDVQMMSYQTESLENRSKKYPGLSITEENEIDSNKQLSNIMKERLYADMFGKKQQDAWLEDRSNIRKQYISQQASTGDEEEDKLLVNLSQTMDLVREEIVKAGGKGVNKVGDMELLNMIAETNPYTAQIINSVCDESMDSNYGAYFLLNEDIYEQAMKDLAQQNPVTKGGTDTTTIETQNKIKKDKVGFLGSLVEGAFSTVKGATKTITKLGIDAALLPARGVEYLISGTDNVKQFGDKAKRVIDEATNQYEEDVNGNRKFNKRGYGAGKLLGEAGLTTVGTAGANVLLTKAGAALGAKLGTMGAASKYAPQIQKGIEAIDKLGQTGGGKLGKWIINRALNGVEAGLTIQGVSDLVEGDLSEAKDYMSAIEMAIILDTVGGFLGVAGKKLANPGKKITEIVKGEGGLNAKQISQIENEVKAVHSTNLAESPFRTRATEVKTEAIPKLKNNIDTLSKERNELTKSMINDGQKSTYDYLDNVNQTLKDTDLGNIKIIVKNGKWKVSGGTTAGSEAEKQLKEFVDMINAQSDKGTKSLVDTIAAAKQIAKEAQIAGKTNKMTKAISEFSAKLEEDAKALYPDIWGDISKKNGELSDLIGMRNKILDLGDDYSSIASKMNSDTDFYRFMDDLYKKGYTTEHIGNKTLGTYYTMGLRTPELLSEQAKLFYPSIPGLQEAAINRFMKQAKQTYGGLNVLAGEDVVSPRYKMSSDVYQLNKANNR